MPYEHRNRHGHRIYLALLVFLIIGPFGFGQTDDFDKRIQSKSSELENIRAEIKSISQKLSRTQRSEKDAISNLNSLDRQISLIKQLKRELVRERELKQKQINLLQATISANQEKMAMLRRRYATRVVNVYKMGTREDWQLVMSAADLSQAFQRMYYLKALHQAEANLLNQIHRTLRDTDAAKAKLELRLAQVAASLEEEAATEKQLLRSQTEKARELKRIRQSASSLKQELQQKKEAASELEKIIAGLEREKQRRLAELARRRGTSERQAATKFASMKGRLPWPVDGRVTAKFGLQRNTRLKTVMDNPGIDIAAGKGMPVKVVMDGIVVAITWIPGFGNTLIVDHGGGFYSVYAHVDDVRISATDYVVSGETIAVVSNSGSYDGYKLHFEIWADNNKLNPQDWLRR
ncbi:MAG: peptidoglycan DD-metalloendopeptidase family protein [Candidatus Marinimicrobia bacterium]|nr:peptidoglycan DD-metalloendopeptidase family protein [Candidatus Neomarinimicrobiota bacterium]